ncbi:MAG: hypothetical protein LH603_21810 [Pseudonocardia sp.]|nr:hypothetical protein [Pseudonocardia sp.]
MTNARVTALIVGALLMLPGVGLLFGGGLLGAGYAFGRDEDGYVTTTLDLRSPTVAVTGDDLVLTSPGWPIDALVTDTRLRVTSTRPDRQVFAGIGPAADVDAYLAGAGHDAVVGIGGDGPVPLYRSHPGSSEVAPPTAQQLWVSSATGPGTQDLNWKATDGRWTVVVMNAHGAPAVACSCWPSCGPLSWW